MEENMPTPDSSFFSELTRLKANTPPSLARAAGVNPDAKAFGVYYAGTEARVTDGYTDHGFSYFGIYAPVMSHPMIAHVAACRDFGSDESEPKDMLLFEVRGSIYFGPYGRAQRALTKINEHLLRSERDLAEILKRTGSVDINAIRQMGGFETLLGPTTENEALGVRVIRELDAQITWETIEELAACDGPGMEAMNALVYADNNAARLGLDPGRVRRAREAYREKLIAEVNDHFADLPGAQTNDPGR
jgi:hypothetical protein